MNTVEASGTDVTVSVPLCAFAISALMASPSPVPCCLCVTKGSKMWSNLSDGIPQPLSFTRMVRD